MRRHRHHPWAAAASAVGAAPSDDAHVLSPPPPQGNIYLWNYNTAQLLKSFEVTELPVRSAKFVARKGWIVCGADDMMVRPRVSHRRGAGEPGGGGEGGAVKRRNFLSSFPAPPPPPPPFPIRIILTYVGLRAYF